MDDRWTQEQIFSEDKNEDKEFGVAYLIKKTKIKRKKKFSLFIFCCLIFFVGIAYLTINIFSSLTYSVNAESSDSVIGKNNYYAISITSGNSYELSSSIASQIQSLGGAGYLFFKNGIYYVLVSVYKTQSDATIVKKKLENAKYDKCEIITITTKELRSVNYYKKMFNCSKSDVEFLFKYINETINLLFTISIDYDKKVLNFNTAKENIINLYNTYYSKTSSFILTSKGIQETKEFVNILEIINNELKKRSDVLSQESTFSYQVKYSLIHIILTLT